MNEKHGQRAEQLDTHFASDRFSGVRCRGRGAVRFRIAVGNRSFQPRTNAAVELGPSAATGNHGKGRRRQTLQPGSKPLFPIGPPVVVRRIAKHERPLQLMSLLPIGQLSQSIGQLVAVSGNNRHTP